MSQFVVYRVSDQYFAVSITSASKIIAFEEVIKVPESSEYILGVMEIEGELLPIIDLPKRFLNKELEDKETAQVLVVFWENKEVGLAVDEVVNINEYSDEQMDTDIEKITRFGVSEKTTPIHSFIRTDKGIILEIELDEFFESTGSLELEKLFDFETVHLKEEIK